jgi:hypothetical protein
MNEQISDADETTLALYRYNGSEGSADGIVNAVDTEAKQVTVVVNTRGIAVFGNARHLSHEPCCALRLRVQLGRVRLSQSSAPG